MFGFLKWMFGCRRDEATIEYPVEYPVLNEKGAIKADDLILASKIIKAWADDTGSDLLYSLLPILDDAILHKRVIGWMKAGDANVVIKWCAYKDREIYMIGDSEFASLEEAKDAAENACFIEQCIQIHGKDVWLVNGKHKFDTREEAHKFCNDKIREFEERTGRKQ